MRNSAEQMDAILEKAEQKRAKKRMKARVLREAGLSLFCLCLIVCASFFIPGAEQTRQENSTGVFGSLIQSSPYLGYIVIGTLSFSLGICLTLLCLHLRAKDANKKGEKSDDD